jgi:hypothetical protein
MFELLSASWAFVARDTFYLFRLLEGTAKRNNIEKVSEKSER